MPATTLNLILGLVNAAIPGVTSIIAMIRNKSGAVTVVTLLDQADAQIAANDQQLSAWFAAHTPAAPKQ